MRYLGIDFGAKRIGLALSDEGGQFAFPHETIPNDATSIDRIQKIAHKEGVGILVIGDTRTVHGAENPITEAAEVFANTVSAHLGIPCERMWEAWSSIEASRYAPKGSEHSDSAAAAIILQRYIDTKTGRA